MKYMGSKSLIAKEIVPIIQRCIDQSGYEYIEPFVGGANIIDKIKCENKKGYDINKHLIELLNHVKNDGELPEDVSFEEYKDARSNRNNGKYDDWYLGCVSFLASYNGRGFDGGYAKNVLVRSNGKEKVRNYYQESKRNVLRQRENLVKCTFICEDYLNLNPSEKVIYCDPPYENKTQYNGVNFDSIEFWDRVRIWSKDNIVIISEENAPDDFVCIWEKEVNRTIKVKDKKKATEKLFIHKNNIKEIGNE